jgi:hypothetical protein
VDTSRRVARRLIDVGRAIVIFLPSVIAGEVASSHGEVDIVR